MTFAEARAILYSRSVSSTRELCEIGSAFEDVADEERTIPDMLALLRGAGQYDVGNSVKCFCALVLYRKSNRSEPKEVDHLGFPILDYNPASWEHYLREHGFLDD